MEIFQYTDNRLLATELLNPIPTFLSVGLYLVFSMVKTFYKKA